MANKKFICQNCGECCGPVVITPVEKERIRKFLLKHPEIAEYAKSKYPITLDCIFRNEKDKKCMIYDVRPAVCRAYHCEKSLRQNKDDFNQESPKCRASKYSYINECFGSKDFRELYRLCIDKLNVELKKDGII